MNNARGVFSIPRLKPRALKTPGHYSHINTQLYKLEMKYFLIKDYFSKKWIVYEPIYLR